MPARIGNKRERNAQIIAAREGGASYAEIAERFFLAETTVRTIYSHYLRWRGPERRATRMAREVRDAA